MKRRKYSITAEPTICRHCGEETSLDIAVRVDAPAVDPSWPVGARFLYCSAECAREATGRKE